MRAAVLRDCEAYDRDGVFITYRLDGIAIGGRADALAYLFTECGFSMYEAAQYLEALPVERWHDWEAAN